MTTKLTNAQRRALELLNKQTVMWDEIVGEWRICRGNMITSQKVNARVVKSLIAHGLLSKVDDDEYAVSAAGRAALGGERSVTRDELPAALDLLASGAVQPIEGKDFVRVPQPPAAAAPAPTVKLTKPQRAILERLDKGETIRYNEYNLQYRSLTDGKCLIKQVIDNLLKMDLVKHVTAATPHGMKTSLVLTAAGRAALSEER